LPARRPRRWRTERLRSRLRLQPPMSSQFHLLVTVLPGQSESILYSRFPGFSMHERSRLRGRHLPVARRAAQRLRYAVHDRHRLRIFQQSELRSARDIRVSEEHVPVAHVDAARLLHVGTRRDRLSDGGNLQTGFSQLAVRIGDLRADLRSGRELLAQRRFPAVVRELDAEFRSGTSVPDWRFWNSLSKRRELRHAAALPGADHRGSDIQAVHYRLSDANGLHAASICRHGHILCGRDRHERRPRLCRQRRSRRSVHRSHPVQERHLHLSGLHWLLERDSGNLHVICKNSLVSPITSFRELHDLG